MDVTGAMPSLAAPGLRYKSVMYSFKMAMRGYNRRQVDELVARIDGTLGRGPATDRPVAAADVRAARFDKQTRGYAPAEVDQALAAPEQELQQREA